MWRGVAMGLLGAIAACAFDPAGIGGRDAALPGAVDAGADAPRGDGSEGWESLSVALFGAGFGVVGSTPTGIDCGTACTVAFLRGTAVTLTATAGEGSVFTGWLGDCADMGECMLTMDAQRRVTATFGSTSPVHFQLGIGGRENDSVRAVDVDVDANVFAAGYVRDTVDFGRGTTPTLGGDDIFVTKYSEDGELEWYLRRGGSMDEAATAILAATDGGVFVTGYFEGNVVLGEPGTEMLSSEGLFDGFVARYSAGGELDWAVRIGGAGNDCGTALALAPSGDLVVGGSFEQSVSFGPGRSETSAGEADWFVLSIDAGTGAVTNHWVDGDEKDDRLGGLAVTASGAYWVAGQFTLCTTFVGMPACDDDARTECRAVGTEDFFLAHYTGFPAEVNADFVRCGGGRGSDDINGLEAVGEQVVAVGMYTNTPDLGERVLRDAGNKSDAFVSRWDSVFGNVWANGFGVVGADDVATDVAITASGEVLVTGTIQGDAVDLGGGVLTLFGGVDLFMGRFASDGPHRASRAYGGMQKDQSWAIAARPAPGGFVLGGDSAGMIDLGGGEALPRSGKADGFVASFNR